MAGLSNNLLVALNKECVESQENIAGYVMAGLCTDFADYKEKTGQFMGIQAVKDRMLGLQDTLDEA